jgi:hypothetical protein
MDFAPISPEKMPTSLPVNGAGLGLRAARLPWLFLPHLRPGSWWPLFHPDPTSLSTGMGTSYRGSPQSKTDDNARAKGGARRRKFSTKFA